MAESNFQVPLVKDGQYPIDECPPYKEVDMSGGYEQQHAFNHPPAFAYQQPPTAPVAPVMSAPPAAAGGPAVSSTVTAVNFAMPAGMVPVGPRSMQLRCYHCQAFVKTRIQHHCKSSAHIGCCLLFIFSCGLFSCVPYCMNSCKRVDHWCPNCGSFLGSFNA